MNKIEYSNISRPATFSIAHLTTVHPRWDSRIIKMTSSLVRSGFIVKLILADGKGSQIRDGINIVDVGYFNGRLNRIFNGTRMVLKEALRINADIYHIHDPELLTIAIKLVLKGKKVVFDSHEDVPNQILSKPYLTRPLLFLISKFYSIFEFLVCKRLTAIITATPKIRDKFLKINKNVIDINNYPILTEFSSIKNHNSKRNAICYLGGISLERGINELVDSLSLTKSNVTLNLVGEFSEPKVKQALKLRKNWSFVRDYGFLNRTGIKKVFSNSFVGIVTFHPLPNHIDAQPNKMFEYMSAGIPVIASDFPLWREIVEDNHCGLCVDPLSPDKIAEAIDYIFINNKEAKVMGKNGRNAVKRKYNWANEEKKLIYFYYRIMNVR